MAYAAHQLRHRTPCRSRLRGIGKEWTATEGLETSTSKARNPLGYRWIRKTDCRKRPNAKACGGWAMANSRQRASVMGSIKEQ